MTFHIIFLSTHSTGEHRAVHLVINLHSPPFLVVLRDIPANNVTHRLYTQRHLLIRGNTSFEPQSVKIGSAVRPGRVAQKKLRTGTYRTEKVTKQ